jgi:hypothetical protein
MDDRDILQPETLLTRDMRLNVKEAEAGQTAGRLSGVALYVS